MIEHRPSRTIRSILIPGHHHSAIPKRPCRGLLRPTRVTWRRRSCSRQQPATSTACSTMLTRCSSRPRTDHQKATRLLGVRLATILICAAVVSLAVAAAVVFKDGRRAESQPPGRWPFVDRARFVCNSTSHTCSKMENGSWTGNASCAAGCLGCPAGYDCLADGPSFAAAVAKATRRDKLALLCDADAPCTISGTQLGGNVGLKARVIMENVIFRDNTANASRYGHVCSPDPCPDICCYLHQINLFRRSC